MTFRFPILVGVLGLVCVAHAAERGGTFFGQPPDPAKSRNYYVAAEPVQWDYAPGGRNDVCGDPAPPSLQGDRVVAKVRYIRYTDDTFTTRIPDDPRLGILGPVLRGVTGEFLVVHFLNRAGQPLSMHPHGVKYDKDSEGARCQLGSGRGASIEPGGRFTYVWQLDEASGPLPSEPSSKGWLYHSHVTGDDEINLGLVGAIIVTDAARARPDGTPADVDREQATLFMLFDESGLGAEEKEAYEYVDNGSGIPKKSWAEVQELLEIGTRAAINGRTFGNLPGLEMNEGERVRWYLFALGSELDMHTAHWHGQRVIEEGRRRTDVIELMPASMKVADFVADNPGDWLFHCHVADHMREGMFARMTVYAKDMVGAARTPAAAFLGLAGAEATLRLTRVDHGTGGVLRIEGEATVPEAFTVRRAKVKIGAGAEKLVALQLDPAGAARAEGAVFRVTNAGATGVVYGGWLRFEADLPDTNKKDGAGTLTLEIGETKHRTQLR